MMLRPADKYNERSKISVSDINWFIYTKSNKVKTKPPLVSSSQILVETSSFLMKCTSEKHLLKNSRS